MTQYNTLNVEFSNSQPNKLRYAIKNGTEVNSNLSSNLIGNSNDKINFSQKLLLNDTQVTKIRQAFANGSSANIKFLKTHLSKMIQPGGVFCNISIFGNFWSVAKKGTDIARNLGNIFLDKHIDKFNKECTTSTF